MRKQKLPLLRIRKGNPRLWALKDPPEELSLAPMRKTAAALPLLALLLLPWMLTGCQIQRIALAASDGKWNFSYAVVASEETYQDPEWREVVDAMVTGHQATLVLYSGDVSLCRERLAPQMPRYTAFVARPEECGRDYVAAVHRLTRKLDDDPWLDTQWGIITGKNAQKALALTQTPPPLEITRALATTGLREELFNEYFLLSDANPPGGWLWKKPGGSVARGRDNLGKNDAFAWAEYFNNSVPDLLVTSSHGFENGVEMPFGRGILRVKDGQLYPIADPRQKAPAADTPAIFPSDNRKVYFPVGNCLVGHVNGPDCMVTAMMGEYGVRQMAGYTVNTWFGRGGWDMLALWQKLPARYSFSEAFFFNQQAMLADIQQLDPAALNYTIRLGEGEVGLQQHIQDMATAGLKFDPRNMRNPRNRQNKDAQLVGLLWDIDTVAFYGDPAWHASFEALRIPSFLSVGVQHLGGQSFQLQVTINDPASAMQNDTPLCLMFTTRLRNPRIVSGYQYQPVLADNFIMLRNPRPQPGESTITVEFEGEPIE